MFTTEKRKRVQFKTTGKCKVDHSFKKGCDINLIMAQYAKTGLLPTFQQKQEQYGDFSDIPTLETALDIVNNASNAFMQLPSDVRKLMDHDPSKLAQFVSNSENKEICLKYGLLEQKQKNDTIDNAGSKTSKKDTQDATRKEKSDSATN